MGNAHMEIFLYYIYFWSCFPSVYDLTAEMSHCIKVVVRKGKKNFYTKCRGLMLCVATQIKVLYAVKFGSKNVPAFKNLRK